MQKNFNGPDTKKCFAFEKKPLVVNTANKVQSTQKKKILVVVGRVE